MNSAASPRRQVVAETPGIGASAAVVAELARPGGMEHSPGRGRFTVLGRRRVGGRAHKIPDKQEETSMRTRTILLVGAGVLALCIGPAGAKDRSARATASTESGDLITIGNNPARRYTSGHNERAVKSGTLYQAGNNPAKRYPSRTGGENAAKDQTLLTDGNNPARKAKSAETTGAGSADRRIR